MVITDVLVGAHLSPQSRITIHCAVTIATPCHHLALRSVGLCWINRFVSALF